MNYSTLIKEYVIKDSASDEDLKLLYASINPGNKMIHILMNNQYLAWRTTANPNLDYESKFFYKEGKLKGYFFVALKNGSANLTGLTYSSEPDLGIMILFIRDFLKSKEVYILNYFGNKANSINAGIFKTLESIGFVSRVNHDMPYIYINSLRAIGMASLRPLLISI